MRRGRPTIGVLVGWQAFAPTMSSFLRLVFAGIQTAARERDCNLLLACGISPAGPTVTRPAWPVSSPDTDFVPVGPWNTDGLIVVNPLLSDLRSSYIQHLIATGFPIVFVGIAEGGPAIAVDNEGNFLPIWRDGRTKRTHIFRETGFPIALYVSPI